MSASLFGRPQAPARRCTFGPPFTPLVQLTSGSVITVVSKLFGDSYHPAYGTEGVGPTTRFFAREDLHLAIRPVLSSKDNQRVVFLVLPPVAMP